MSDKIYLWLEDREEKSGFVFWKTMMQQLFPEVVVQSKKNNSELIKAVKALDDETGSYIIVLDNSFDNLQLVSERKRLQHYVLPKKKILFALNTCCLNLNICLIGFMHQKMNSVSKDKRQSMQETNLWKCSVEMIGAIKLQGK